MLLHQEINTCCGGANEAFIHQLLWIYDRIRPRRYECSICNKMYGDLSALVQHAENSACVDILQRPGLVATLAVLVKDVE